MGIMWLHWNYIHELIIYYETIALHIFILHIYILHGNNNNVTFTYEIFHKLRNNIHVYVIYFYVIKKFKCLCCNRIIFTVYTVLSMLL